MTNPHAMLAEARARSLRASLAALHRAVLHPQTVDDGHSPLRSPTPSIGRGHGGHSDPVGLYVIGSTGTGHATSRYQTLAASTSDLLAWICTSTFREPTHGDQLDAITAALPMLPPAAAHAIGQWLDDADQRIRQALGMEPDQTNTRGACPACHRRLLRTLNATADPQTHVTICASEACRCQGEGCPCRMPIQPAGAVHVWAAVATVAA